MSVEKPTEKQLAALKKIHTPTLGWHTVGQIPDKERGVITFCPECKQEWPCRTMKALGVKK